VHAGCTALDRETCHGAHGGVGAFLIVHGAELDRAAACIERHEGVAALVGPAVAQVVVLREHVGHARRAGAFGGDGAAHELGRHGRALCLAPQVGGPEGVHVAADDQRIAAVRLVRGQAVEQARAGGRVAVPAVHPVAVLGAAPAVGLGQQRGLRDHGPARGRRRELAGEPGFLRRAEEAAPGREPVGAVGQRRGAAAREAGVVRAVLAPVGQQHVEHPAETVAAVDGGIGAARAHGGGHGHVLVPGLVGRGADREKLRGVDGARRHVVGVVVGDLVVVPGHEPGKGGVRGLQMRIGLVQRIAVAERRQLRRNAAAVVPHVARAPGAFVDVVAEVHDEVQRLRRHVAVGREVALLVLLARREGEAQRRRGPVAFRRRGARAPGRAACAVRCEAIPIDAARPQSLHLDVHRVRQLRACRGRTLRDNAPEGLVVRDLPAHLDRRVAHAATLQRLGREPRPEHHAVGPRRARGHAERERLARCLLRMQPQERMAQRRRSQPAAQQAAARDGRRCAAHPRAARARSGRSASQGVRAPRCPTMIIFGNVLCFTCCRPPVP
jgi:hypothetical protein